MRGADALVRALEAAGVSTVFSLSGNQIMPVFDACLGRDIRLIHTRHEAAAVYMAEGQAQITGGVGVALVTAGAGLGNAIAPLLTARASQTPLLLLSGDSPVGLDGQGAFQEMDQVGLTTSVTKLSRRIMAADDVAAEVRAAFDAAQSGQPGPVHLSLPADVLLAEARDSGPNAPVPRAPLPDIASMVAALRIAARPLILLGPALCRGTVARDFAALGLPAIPMQSPRGANDPSLGRFGQAWAEADLVLALGKPVDFSLRFGAATAWGAARWITVHGDAAEEARARRALGDRLGAAYCAAPLEVARALIAGFGPVHPAADWAARIAALTAARAEAPQEARGRLTSAGLCRGLGAFVAGLDDPILVSDGGEIGQWAQALVQTPRRIVNGVSGAIGGGIGYAMGAKSACPEAPVILLMGDGTAGFHLTEFETAVRENLPFVAVIGNDRRWNAEHELQRRNFGPDRMHGCTLSGARYDQAVTGLGGFGAHVTRAEDLAPALAQALASGLPACVNVEITGLPAPSLA